MKPTAVCTTVPVHVIRKYVACIEKHARDHYYYKLCLRFLAHFSANIFAGLFLCLAC